MSLDNNLWVVFFLTILVMFSTKGQGQQRIEVKKLVEECQILTTTLGELHPDLYRYTPQEQFNAKVDSIVRSLDSTLDPIEFYLRISPIVTQIKNGHTAIKPAKQYYDSIKILPLRLIVFERKVYVYKDLSLNGEKLTGAQVSLINGVFVEDIVRRSMNLVSVDGFNDHARFKAVVEDDLAFFFSLFYGSPRDFEIEFIDHTTNEIGRRKLGGISYHDFISRYDREDEINWTLHKIDSSNTALLTLRSFNTEIEMGGKKMYFHKTMAEYFKRIKDWGVDRLILDIRFNGGGELKNSILLYSYLARTPFQFSKGVELASLAPPTHVKFTNYVNAIKHAPISQAGAIRKSQNEYIISNHFSQRTLQPKKYSFQGELVVLINGNTASAAGALASCIKNDNRGLIVGEQNRDNYTGFSAGVPILLTLPYSGITVSIPIRKFTYAEGPDKGQGVVPDYIFPTTCKDFFEQQNAAVKFATVLFGK